jgi:hypothetical protein
VSVVALIVALGGTSYAAFTLPNGSVGTPQLKNKAVTNSKLAPLSVGTAKIRNGAVGATQINTTGLTVPRANSLGGIQVVPGPTLTLGPFTQSSSTVNCPTGLVAIGGNETNTSGNPFASLNEVRINAPGNASITVFMNNGTAATLAWRAYAVCVSGSSTGAALRAGSGAK